MKKSGPERWALFGVSRGLGGAFLNRLLESTAEDQILAVSRRPPQATNERLRFFSQDLSRPDLWPQLEAELMDFSPTRVVYFAGGGPHGPLQSKEWKDHLWAWEVSLLRPAQILHWALRQKGVVRQFCLLGSAVAEGSPDPLASSYASAKHGLLGLVSSLLGEKPPMDVRLFSPGYMDTDFLPKGARPRQAGENVLDPKEVATELLSWLNDSTPKSQHILRIPAEL